MTFWFKAYNKTLTIVPLKVLSVEDDFLLIETKNQYDNKEAVRKRTVDFTCFPKWEDAHKYLCDLSSVELDRAKKDFNKVLEAHSRIESMINPINPTQQYQAA